MEGLNEIQNRKYEIQVLDKKIALPPQGTSIVISNLFFSYSGVKDDNI